MKKLYIILNLVFLFFIAGCVDDEEIIKDIINEEIIGEVLDTKNKIFLNVIDKDKMYVPLEKDGEEIKWEYDSKYLSLEGNQFEVKKDGNEFNLKYIGNDGEEVSFKLTKEMSYKEINENLTVEISANYVFTVNP